MKPEYAVWSIIALVLLLVGIVIGYWAVNSGAETSQPLEAPNDDGFRRWFWEQRTLDLVAQAGLIFAGALGVAALLPGPQEAHIDGNTCALPPAQVSEEN